MPSGARPGLRKRRRRFSHKDARTPSLSPDQIRRRVTEAEVARLATVDTEGRPHLVPICFAYLGDIVYSGVDAKPKRSLDLKRLRNIESNPSVALLVDQYFDDWERVWWCRLDGRAHLVSDGEQFEAGLAALAEKYRQYREAPPEGRIVVMDVLRATGWTAS